jgi:hypothetical protein
MGLELGSSPTFYFFPLLMFYFPLCDVVLLFAMLLSFLRCCYPLQLLFYFRYKVLRATFLLFALLSLVCCYLLKNLILPSYIPSCRSWEWSWVKNWKLVFFSKYFPLCLFPFYFLKSHIFFSFVFFYKKNWLLVCGVSLVINYFGDKHKPLYFWQF